MRIYGRLPHSAAVWALVVAELVGVAGYFVFAVDGVVGNEKYYEWAFKGACRSA